MTVNVSANENRYETAVTRYFEAWNADGAEALAKAVAAAWTADGGCTDPPPEGGPQPMSGGTTRSRP